MTVLTIESTAVPSAAGDLNALIYIPDIPGPLPGIVLVDGSGDGTADGWGQTPHRLAAGAVVLAHDKPGCGGSSGHWIKQSIHDRAQESLAAVETLRAHPKVSKDAIGLYGVSQGGWVALLAASLDVPVDFVVSVSGPGVSPARQDRFRIENALRGEACGEQHVAEALGWMDERAKRLRAGDRADSILAIQETFADRPWYGSTSQYLDNAPMLDFLAGILDFEPAAVLPQLGCPVLALFGAADPTVPVAESVTVFAQLLPTLPGQPHGIAVFPGADHGLYTAAPDPTVDRTSQLAPGFLPMVHDFIRSASLRAT